MCAIRVEALGKSFGNVAVLKGCTFEVPDGSVTGLLGPNGSGKTTLLRCMVGLATPDHGRTLFDGLPYRDLPSPGRTVGCLFDVSAHHGGRTAGETIRLEAMYRGLAAADAQAALRRVGLADVERRRFGALSLGMRQRLGIGIALLGDPKVLLLDEPTNGLDIETIMWVRDLIVEFTRERGGAVLVSSHLLSELQTYADRVVILGGGRVAHEGTMVDVRAGAQQSVVRTPYLQRLMSLLDEAGVTHRLDGDRLIVDASTQQVGELAFTHAVVLHELTQARERTLEQFYLSISQGTYTPEQVTS